MSFWLRQKQKNNTASVARTPADHHCPRTGPARQPDYLPQLQQELLDVIRKYVQISDDMVQVDVDRNGCSVLN